MRDTFTNYQTARKLKVSADIMEMLCKTAAGEMNDDEREALQEQIRRRRAHIESLVAKIIP